MGGLPGRGGLRSAIGRVLQLILQQHLFIRFPHPERFPYFLDALVLGEWGQHPLLKHGKGLGRKLHIADGNCSGHRHLDVVGL